MLDNLTKILLQIGWFWITLCCIFLFLTTSVYLTFRDDIHFLLAKPDMVHHIIWRPVFYFHIVSGMVCIAIGPFQFIPSLRKKYVATHRLMGKLYIGAILFLAAPTGLYMAFYANGGFWSGAGFFMLSLFWWTTTYLAYSYIKKGNVTEHRRFMTYSFALTFSAVTLRLWVPILSNWFGVDHNFTIIITAWINWIPNLIVAHLFVKFLPKRL